MVLYPESHRHRPHQLEDRSRLRFSKAYSPISDNGVEGSTERFTKCYCATRKPQLADIPLVGAGAVYQSAQMNNCLRFPCCGCRCILANSSKDSFRRIFIDIFPYFTFWHVTSFDSAYICKYLQLVASGERTVLLYKNRRFSEIISVEVPLITSAETKNGVFLTNDNDFISPGFTATTPCLCTCEGCFSSISLVQMTQRRHGYHRPFKDHYFKDCCLRYSELLFQCPTYFNSRFDSQLFTLVSYKRCCSLISLAQITQGSHGYHQPFGFKNTKQTEAVISCLTNELINDNQISVIAKYVGGQWKEMFQSIGLPQFDLDCAESDTITGSLYEKIIFSLCKYRQLQGQNCTTGFVLTKLKPYITNKAYNDILSELHDCNCITVVISALQFASTENLLCLGLRTCCFTYSDFERLSVGKSFDAGILVQELITKSVFVNEVKGHVKKRHEKCDLSYDYFAHITEEGSRTLALTMNYTKEEIDHFVHDSYSKGSSKEILNRLLNDARWRYHCKLSRITPYDSVRNSVISNESFRGSTHDVIHDDTLTCDIYDVCRAVGTGVYEFGISLGLSNLEVTTVISEYQRHGSKEIICRMIHIWQNKIGKGATLARAIQSNPLTRARFVLQKKLKGEAAKWRCSDSRLSLIVRKLLDDRFSFQKTMNLLSSCLGIESSVVEEIDYFCQQYRDVCNLKFHKMFRLLKYYQTINTISDIRQLTKKITWFEIVVNNDTDLKKVRDASLQVIDLSDLSFQLGNRGLEIGMTHLGFQYHEVLDTYLKNDLCIYECNSMLLRHQQQDVEETY